MFAIESDNVTRENRVRLTAAAVLSVLLPLQAVNADDSIDPTLIPDGTYPAHVDRVINAQRIAVTMQGTLKVFLTSGRPNLNFSDKVRANDDVDVTLADGKVMAVNKK